MPFCRASRWCCLGIVAWQVLLSTAITLHHRHEGGGTTHSHAAGCLPVLASESPLGEPPHAHLILFGLEFFLGEEDENTPTSPAPALSCTVEIGYRPGGVSDHDRYFTSEFAADAPLLMPMASFGGELIICPTRGSPIDSDIAPSVALLNTSCVLLI